MSSLRSYIDCYCDRDLSHYQPRAQSQLPAGIAFVNPNPSAAFLIAPIIRGGPQKSVFTSSAGLGRHFCKRSYEYIIIELPTTPMDVSARDSISAVEPKVNSVIVGEARIRDLKQLMDEAQDRECTKE